jgi:putative DNA primase/helicase
MSGENVVRPATILTLHKIGFKVVPLGPDGKTPIIGWSPIYDVGWNQHELSQKFGLFNNIATCFGKSHLKDDEGRDLYLNCLDIDSAVAADSLRNYQDPSSGKRYSLIDELKSRTYVVQTRKPFGIHCYWFSHELNKPIASSDCKKGNEFEIKTDKASGLCSLPPSRHRDAEDFHYNLVGQNTIISTDALYGHLVTALGMCLSRPSNVSGKGQSRFLYDGAKYDVEIEIKESKDLDAIFEAMKPIYKKGYRNQVCLYLSGFLHKNKVAIESTKEIISRLAKDDEEKNLRFLTLTETYRKDRSAVNGYRALFNLVLAVGQDYAAAKALIAGIYSKIVRYKKADDTKDVAYLLSQTIKGEYTFLTLNDTREVLQYDNGRYVYNGERTIEIECSRLIPNVMTPIVKETIEMIRRTTPVDRKLFDKDIEWLSLQNCMVNLRTAETKPHSPSFLTLVQLPVKYDSEADWPANRRFLEEILPAEIDRLTLIDYSSYCLWRDFPIHKSLMEVGSGRNGKGTWNRVLAALLGQENVSAVTLHDLDANRFMAANLYGKLANIGPDLKSRVLADTGMFKALTGNDEVEVEKKHLNSFKMRNFAKMIFATNQIPDTLDDTDAFFARWIILNFTKQFLNENADPHLIEKLTTPEELSGLFNLLMKNIPNILANGIRSSAKTIEETYEKYMASADPIRLFREMCIEKAPGVFVTKLEMYEAYSKWTLSKSLGVESIETFGRRMKQYGFKDSDRRKGKERFRVWDDVKLIDWKAVEEGQEVLHTIEEEGTPKERVLNLFDKYLEESQVTSVARSTFKMYLGNYGIDVGSAEVLISELVTDGKLLVEESGDLKKP